MTVTLRKGIANFVTRRLSLARGGLYRVTGGGASRIVKVDSYAANGGSVISRLIAL